MAHRSHQPAGTINEGKRIKTETTGVIGDTPIRLRRIILMPANGRRRGRALEPGPKVAML
jgi:hypothetical protein